MPFKLQSQFTPAGDQGQAIGKISGLLKKGAPQVVLMGVTGSGKTFTVANVVNKLQWPTLVISHNKTLAAQLTQEFKEFFPRNAVEYFVSYYDYYQPEAYIPQTDTYIEKEANINEEIDRLRLSTTASLATRSDVIVCASVSCIYNIGSPESWQNKFIKIDAFDCEPIDTIIEKLVGLFYTRSDFDLKRGTFRVRGHRLQIFPAHLNKVVELDLPGISLYDPLFTEKPQAISKFTIYPAKHHVLQDEGVSPALLQIRDDLKERVDQLEKAGRQVEAYRLKQKTNYDLEMIQELGYCSGIENYSRYFDGRKEGEPPYTLIDYFKRFNQWLLVVDESHITIPQIRGMYRGDRARKETLIEHGFRLPSALDNRPLRFDEFRRKVGQTLYTSATPSDWELSLAQNAVVEQIIRPTGLVDPEIKVLPTENQITHLLKKIKERVGGRERVLVTTLTKRMAEALSDKLTDSGIKAAYLHSDIDTLERSDILDDLRSGKYDVLVGINLLREGLDLPEVSLVAILDADKEGFLRSKTSLIQVMGRAARHLNGAVIMYADKVTGSMQEAIDEVNRRREIQLAYNKKHNITPASIVKGRRTRLIEKKQKISSNSELSTLNLKRLPPNELAQLAENYELKMKTASDIWDFEAAAFFRDELKKIKKLAKKMSL